MFEPGIEFENPSDKKPGLVDKFKRLANVDTKQLMLPGGNKPTTSLERKQAMQVPHRMFDRFDRMFDRFDRMFRAEGRTHNEDGCSRSNEGQMLLNRA